MGGIALAFHDLPRFTKGIDLLILPRAEEKVQGIFEKLDYFESAEPWKFTKTDLSFRRFLKVEGHDYMLVGLLVGREPKHQEIFKWARVERGNGGTVRIAQRDDLIWMKQLRNSDQDQVDIKRLKDDPN